MFSPIVKLNTIVFLCCQLLRESEANSMRLTEQAKVLKDEIRRCVSITRKTWNTDQIRLEWEFRSIEKPAVLHGSDIQWDKSTLNLYESYIQNFVSEKDFSSSRSFHLKYFTWRAENRQMSVIVQLLFTSH